MFFSSQRNFVGRLQIIIAVLTGIAICAWELRSYSASVDTVIGANFLIACYAVAGLAIWRPIFSLLSVRQCLYIVVVGSVFCFLFPLFVGAFTLCPDGSQNTYCPPSHSVEAWQIAVRYVIPVLVGIWLGRKQLDQDSSGRTFYDASRYFGAGLGYFLILASLVLYFDHLISNRSFWIDEVKIAISLNRYTPYEFVFGIGDGQYFPDIYLALIRALIEVTEFDNRLLRVIPFVLSCAGLLLWLRVFQKLSIEICGVDGRSFNKNVIWAFGVLLYASVYLMYYYAGELKPYSGDVFCSAIAALALPKFGNAIKEKDDKRVLLGLLYLSFPCLVSQTYIFVLAASAITVIVIYWRAIINKFWFFMSCGTIPLAAMTYSYLRDISETQNEGLIAYWQYGMIRGDDLAEFGVSFMTRFWDLMVGWWEATDTALLVIVQIILLLFVLLSMFETLRSTMRGRYTNPVLLMPVVLIALLIAGSIVGVFPVHGSSILSRVCLFVCPFIILHVIVGAGVMLRNKGEILGSLGTIMVCTSFTMILFWHYPATVGSAANIVATMEGPYIGREDWQDLSPALRSIDCGESSERTTLLVEQHLYHSLLADARQTDCQVMQWRSRSEKLDIKQIDLEKVDYVLTRFPDKFINEISHLSNQTAQEGGADSEWLIRHSYLLERVLKK